MKKFDKVMVMTIVAFLLVSFIMPFIFQSISSRENSEYKVEINEIYSGLVKQTTFTKPALGYYKYIKSVTFFPKAYERNQATSEDFFSSINGMGYEIRPLYKGDKLSGYIRFNYAVHQNNGIDLGHCEIMLFAFCLIIIFIMLYIRNSIIKPFNTLSEVPFELSKGNFKNIIKESPNRYFGKFLWGINVLKDNLDYDKRKILSLEREKKLLLLSISHDIKTPLNTIKLYAKAIEEQLYDTDEKKISAAKQISEKSLEIENFVKEIIRTSSEDILDFQVNISEFYLKDLMDKVIASYSEKCQLNLIDFKVTDYSNKLVKGDLDRAFEVIGNVMENAIKYGDSKLIKISFYEEDYCQLIKIYNSGETLSQNEFNHIFDSFYRGTNVKDKQGSGLGLYICKYIMEKMDGEIFAECESGGMSFTLVLRM